MTTNIDRARNSLNRALVKEVQLGNLTMDADQGLERRLAQALAADGLLMPDLPEPDSEGYFHTTYEYMTYENTEIQHDQPAVAWVEEPGIVGLDTGIESHMGTDEARTVACALFAAADHAERIARGDWPITPIPDEVLKLAAILTAAAYYVERNQK